MIQGLVRPVLLLLASVAFSLVLLNRVQAGGSHYFPPVADPLVNAECGSCHLAFSPAMLPARSWQALMGDLRNHFGDDASVDPVTAEKIRRYLVANAADARGQRQGGRLLRGLAPERVPLRITELPKWVSEHRELSARSWRDPKVRSRANCTACHVDAALGYYED